MELNEKKLESILTEQREEYQRYLGSLKEDFDSKVEAIGEQYFDIKKTLDSHTEIIVSTKEDIEIIKLDIEFIKNELKKKVDWDEFAALEKRVALVESRLKGAIA